MNERESLLRELLIAKDASYKNRVSGYDEEPAGCLEGTRKDVLAKLESWAFDDTTNKVYWMHGMAGTGKSTIAHSLCERLEEAQMLGASFFCSRTSSTASGTDYIIPTIASRFALESPPIMSQILQQLHEDPELSGSKKPAVQFKQLISEPMLKCFGRTCNAYKVVVIDALDECTDSRKVSSLIKALLQGVSSLPIKLFIASRDENEIREAFTSISHCALILHDVEAGIVNTDIELYLSTSLSKVFRVSNYKHDSYLSTAVPALVTRAGRLFIYAATVIRFVDHRQGQPEERLQSVIEDEKGSDSHLQTAQLDSLYNNVLRRAFDSQLTRKEIATRREVLISIVFAHNPLSQSSIATLIGVQIKNVDLALDSLRSVIHVPDSPDLPVALFPAAFAEFLQESERCKSIQVMAASECHSFLAAQSLRCLNEGFKLNTTSLEYEPAVTDPSAPYNNLAAVKYASLYWALPLCAASPFRDGVYESMFEFMTFSLLKWLECLSKLRELGTGVQ